MNVILWFLIGRWQFKKVVYDSRCVLGGLLRSCHNNNLYGCRKHQVIYNDMCRIVRGVK